MKDCMLRIIVRTHSEHFFEDVEDIDFVSTAEEVRRLIQQALAHLGCSEDNPDFSIEVLTIGGKKAKIYNEGLPSGSTGPLSERNHPMV